jgi:glutamate racemase
LTNNPVAVFDSGIGSLSIIRELRHEIPYEDLLYFADRVHFPYGTKSHSQLREIVVNTINYLKRYNPKLVVVASSTPSVQVLDEVRRTITGIREVPQHILVTRFNASPIIELIEHGVHLENEQRTFNVTSRVLGDSIDEKMDVIALSSTHLPFVKRYLNSLLPTVRFIDPAQIVAKDVRKFLAFYRMTKKSGRSNLRILVSHGKREFEKSVRALGVREPIEEVFLTF